MYILHNIYAYINLCSILVSLEYTTLLYIHFYCTCLMNFSEREQVEPNDLTLRVMVSLV